MNRRLLCMCVPPPVPIASASGERKLQLLTFVLHCFNMANNSMYLCTRFMMCCFGTLNHFNRRWVIHSRKIDKRIVFHRRFVVASISQPPPKMDMIQIYWVCKSDFAPVLHVLCDKRWPLVCPMNYYYAVCSATFFHISFHLNTHFECNLNLTLPSNGAHTHTSNAHTSGDFTLMDLST